MGGKVEREREGAKRKGGEGKGVSEEEREGKGGSRLRKEGRPKSRCFFFHPQVPDTVVNTGTTQHQTNLGQPAIDVWLVCSWC